MIKCLLLLSVLAAFSGCGQPCDLPVEQIVQLPNDTAIVAADTAFLPLAVGNEWTYVNPWIDTLVVCVTTITRKVIKEDSLTYFEMVDNYRGHSASWLLRYRNPYEIEEYAGGERKLYLTMLDSGTDGSWSSKVYPGKIDKYFPRQNIATPAGHFLNCLVFQFPAFEPWSQAYAPGIGMVEWSGMSTWSLRKALVGGKKIGLWPD